MISPCTARRRTRSSFRSSSRTGEQVVPDERSGEGLTSSWIRRRQPLNVGTSRRYAAGAIRSAGRRQRVVDRRAHHRAEPRDRRARHGGSGARRLRRVRRARSSARSRPAWASPSRTRACSTRPSGSWPRRTSAPQSLPSSTRSASAGEAAGLRRDHPAGRRPRPLAVPAASWRSRSTTRPPTSCRAVRPGRGRDLPPRTPAAGAGHDVPGARLGATDARRDDGRAGGGRRDPRRRHRDPSWLGVPDHRSEPGDRRPLARVPHEDVYSEADVRLLARWPRAWAWRSRTRGCSTRRSACSRRPTSAPPSWPIINEVQQALASELDMQAMYDLVGDQIREIFDAQVVDIGIFDRETASSTSRTPSNAACGSRTSRSRGLGLPPARHADTASRCSSTSTTWSGRGTRPTEHAIQGETPKSTLWCRSSSAAKSTGVISLQNLDREYAFTDADVRLLSDARRQPERGARERPPVRRDQAPAGRDRRARRGAGDHQRRPAGAGRRSSTCRRCTTSSATRSATSSMRRSSTSRSSTAKRTRPLPVPDRARRPVPGRADAARRIPPSRRGDAATAARNERMVDGTRVGQAASIQGEIPKPACWRR